MWINETRLPHALRTESYYDPARYALEVDRLFAPAWHCVGTLDDLPRHGDFLTLDLFGTPLLVRNHHGEVRAFLNVCAHRHCLLTHAPHGTAPRLECQYHGWVYDGSGRVESMPDAASFARGAGGGSGRSPFGRDVGASERPALRRFRAAAAARLVFVSLADEGPDLDAFLGARTRARIAEHFSNDYRQVAVRRLEHPANWKVPVENSLESYHVPRVHPKTFKVMVDASDIRHELEERFTSHEDVDQGSSMAYRWLMRRMRRRPRYTYIHHHHFPSLTFACTDVSSVLQVVLPTSPTGSQSIVRAFVHRGDDRRLSERAISRLIAAPVVTFMDQVMKEDGAIFADLQRGLRASVHRGVIGAREERVWAFQQWVERGVVAERATAPRAQRVVET